MFSAKRFAPANNVIRNATLGLDIGAFTTRAVLIEEQGHGLVIRGVANLPTPEGAIRQGAVVEPNRMAATLRTLVRSLRTPIRSAAVALPSAQTQVNWLDLPRMDAEALRQAAPFQARKYLPYAVEQAEVSLTEVPQESRSNTRAMLVAAPRRVVESRAVTVERAGLQVDTMENEAYALVRGLLPGEPTHTAFWRGRSRGFLLLGEEASCLVVVRDGQIVYIRSIAWGEHRIYDALARQTRLSAPEVATLLQRYDAFLSLQGTLLWQQGGPDTTILEPEWKRLGNELMRILRYYSSLFAANAYSGALDGLKISGRLAELHGLPEWLAGQIAMPVQVACPLSQGPWTITPEVAQQVAGTESSYAVALGLALGQIEQKLLQTATPTTSRPTAARQREYFWSRKGA